MKRLKSRDELAAMVEREGGGLEDVLDYGYRVEHMPEGDAELAGMWRDLVDAYAVYEARAERIAKLIGLE